VGFVADVARVLGIVLTILPTRATPFFTIECNSLEVSP
jgi:uncharacterized membrane protein YbaN (DUF454 family)